MKLQNAIGKKINRRRKLIPLKINETMISLKNPKLFFEECFLKYVFLIYVGS